MIPSLEISDLYRVFFRMRSIEQRIAAEYPLGEIRCPVHLSVGQELVSAAFAITHRPGDLAISTHRAHTHYLGKGGSLKKMIAELYGRVTGCSRGRRVSWFVSNSRQQHSSRSRRRISSTNK